MKFVCKLISSRTALESQAFFIASSNRLDLNDPRHWECSRKYSGCNSSYHIARRDGNRLYYSANRDNPLYWEIHNLVLKTVGLVGILSKALSDTSIQCAFIFGSVARHEEKAKSDIDLFVIGDMGLRKLSEVLSKAKSTVDREINPHVMTEKEFVKKRKAKDHFVARVLEGEKMFIKGSEDELNAMG